VPDLLVQLFGLATIASAIRAFVPLYLATLGGVFNERSGIVNIGIDGMMIFGTWFGAWGAFKWGPVAGLLLAIAAGVAAAAVHAMATITFRVDHIVSGVAINILAIGIPRFLSIVAYGQGTQSPQVEQLPKIDVPGLGEISPVALLTSPLVAGGSSSTAPSSGCACARRREPPGRREPRRPGRGCAGPVPSPAASPAWPAATSPSSSSASTARA
jgi:hypothetical protein